MKTLDKRVIRTRQALGQAFETLALTNDYRDITITKLTKAAGINRKTFYLHYDSIDDLVDTFADTVTEHLTRIIRQHTFKEIYAHPGVLLDDFSDFVHAHSAIFRKVLFADDYSSFARRIERALTKVLAESIRESYPMTQQDALIAGHFLISNTLSLFSYFSALTSDDNLDQTPFKSYVSRLNLTGLSSFFKN